MNSLILINVMSLLTTASLKDPPNQLGAASIQSPISEMSADSMSETDQSIYGSAAVRHQLNMLSAKPYLIPVYVPQTPTTAAFA